MAREIFVHACDGHNAHGADGDGIDCCDCDFQHQAADENCHFLAPATTPNDIYGLDIWNWDVKPRCCQMYALDVKFV